MYKCKWHVCLVTSGRIFEKTYGGEEKFTISLGNWLLRKNIDVTIMGSTFAGVKSKRLSRSNDEKNEKNEKNNIDEIDEKNKVKVLYPPYPIYLLSRIFLSLLWIFKIILDHRKFNFSLIHAQDTGFSGISAVIAGKILRIPTIISSHGIRHKSLDSIIQGKFKKILLEIEYKVDIFSVKHSKKVIADSPLIKKYYEEKTKKEIDFVPIPIKVKNFEFSHLKRNSFRNELDISDVYKIICFVGRFSAEKNLITLINSFYGVSQKDPTLILILVGAGIMESQIKNHVKEKGISNKVVFCGSRSDIDRILCGCDIFVLPSFIEGMSTSLLEAMACSRSIICSDISANHYVLTTNEAIFIDPYKEDELELAILKLSKDENLRKKLGISAKMKVIQYDEDIIFSKFVKLYESLLKI
jgi:glycosyltransferase involved in cell wall biosynthesis